MNVYESVKQSISTREAAERYGIEVKRNGMACCPFHDDKNPSMKVDQRFHCFGCGADGDVINFTSMLYNLSPKEAAEKLAQDFGLAYDSQAPPKHYIRQKSEAQKFKEAEKHCFRVLADYLHLLRKWETAYVPADPSIPVEAWHPRFLEVLQYKSYVEYLLDLFIYGTLEEKKEWLTEHTTKINYLERRNKIMSEKQTNKERLREITDGIEQGIKDLFESEKYMRYLSVMSRFHRYSVNNTMLIYMQKPDATLVAGYNKWQNQFERHVKRGEHGITIIAPTPFKKKIEEQKLDPDTKAPMLDKDGKIITEEKEIEIPMFRPVKVFDVSQTDGKPLPQLAANLTGNVQNYEVFLEALCRSAPVPITFEAMSKDTDGYFSLKDQRIAIRSGMSEVQTVSATVHEIAHSKLHNLDSAAAKNETLYQEVEIFDQPALFSNGRLTDKDIPDGLFRYDLRGSDDDPGDPIAVERNVMVNHAASIITAKPLELPEQGYRLFTEDEGLNFTGGMISVRQFMQEHKKDRNTEEVEAESISFAVCQYYGIQTGENSFGYIATWSKDKELPELRASLETINKTAGELISDIDRNYREICKERGIDPLAQTQEISAQKEPDEKLLLVDGVTYLYLQTCEEGYDYTLYDAQTKAELDGGILANTEIPMTAAQREIFQIHGIPAKTVEPADLSLAEELRAIEFAAYHQRWDDTQETSSKTETPPLPEIPEQKLDEYPMPDTALVEDALEKCGYLDDDLLPLSKERAYELMEQDLTVYMIQEGEKPEMAFDTADLDAHDGIFAISCEEWEQTSEFHDKVMERQEHQSEREQAFLSYPTDCFAIYQVKRDDPDRIRFMNMDWLKEHDIPISHDNYDLIYTAPLTVQGNTAARLESLYEQFNMQKPVDFHSPSMSVSDIVAMKQDGVVSCHYVDSASFEDIAQFLPENYLKNAEMALEDDYGMIDGIINNGKKESSVDELEQQARSGQPISLMALADAIQQEKEEKQEKKKSVMEQLKTQPKQEHKKTALKKSAEMEM